MNKEKMFLDIEKEVSNLKTQKDVLSIIRKAVDDYGNKVYNKRFCTFVNKRLIDKFGSKMYERYGREDEEIGNAYCYLSAEEYIQKHTYLHIVFRGVDIRRNYDNDTLYLGEANIHEQLYNTDTFEELATSIDARIAYLDKCIDSIKSNESNLDKLISESKKLHEMVKSYNAKISYVLSDHLRVK